MKTNQILVAGLSLFLSVSAFAQTTVDEVVSKHIAALGGADKIKNVKSLTMEQSLAVPNMEFPTKSVIVVGKSLRTESTIMGNKLVSVVDGTTGWTIKPAMMGGTGEPQDMTDAELKQSSSQLDPFGSLVNYKEKGNTVEYVGKEKVGKKEAHHLKVTTKGGQVSDQYLDGDTYLVNKIVATVNGQTAEISLGDYKEVEGIKLSHLMEIPSPQGTVSIITNKVTVNAPVDETIFKKPGK
ncbi:LolA family protein [Arsenicibacter rosenii]|uniref:Outer membrane lipoprotein-sorting protein n=1 Tax=Arsenicibacter rosenii TaxID=1750698 RepID=A0A1S2VCA0_9BACT|nr:outer membrane lipoprotein-sorting protein [Arsenicibacter rosenii]OIN55558.1 outer membrane lipoprotein-sorting protein [Arsenicibacter rosenii]